MARGFLDYMAANALYADSEKDWHITLKRSSFYWYDLIVNPPDFYNTKSGISEVLNEWKAEIEATSEKRFIYFFVSRPKVRFDVTKEPKYGFFSKQLKLTILVGRDKKPVTIKTRFVDEEKSVKKPKIEITEHFITIHFTSNFKVTYSVHDFLMRLNYNLDEFTTIHYVGITKNPVKRLLSREHRGIADTLYNVSNEENDFFICVNIFDVLTHANNAAHNMVMFVPNDVIDEIKTEEEGRIIENALIEYFKCKSQEIDSKKSAGKLRNSLRSIVTQNRISNVSLHLEVDSPSDYFVFGSTLRPYTRSHTFSFKIVNKNFILTTYQSERELTDSILSRGK